MCNNNIDIIEEDWLKEYGEEVLERLLWEHSRPAYQGEDGEQHHHHIYWATDMYEQEGDGFGFFDEIMIKNITGNYRTLVSPRADKSREEQEKRTRDKAEVFTPSWVCNAQNNLAELLAKWTAELGISDFTWQVKTMKTQWGSCTKKSRSLLFNLELARVPKECIEYVVVHELTHLNVPNHNRLFETMMSQRLPHWRDRRQQLNDFIASEWKE